MKTSVKYSIIALLLCVAGKVYGQGQTYPASVIIDTKDYYRHGYNKSNLSSTAAQEDRDSVTVGSVMQYFVMPDETVSPDYKATEALIKDFTNLNSKFVWEIINRTSPPTTVHGETDGSETPLVTITWKTVTDPLAPDTIRVSEVPTTGAACDGGGSSLMPVAVIPKPELGFLPNDATPFYRDSICLTQAQITAGTGNTIVFPMYRTTKSSQVQAKYTVTLDGEPYDALTVNNPDAPGSSIPFVDDDEGKLTLTFTEYGKYVITLEEVTDRVSRNSFKSDGENYIDGDLIDNKTVASKSFTFLLLKPVTTGPIYRLPNNF